MKLQKFCPTNVGDYLKLRLYHRMECVVHAKEIEQKKSEHSCFFNNQNLFWECFFILLYTFLNQSAKWYWLTQHYIWQWLKLPKKFKCMEPVTKQICVSNWRYLLQIESSKWNGKDITIIRYNVEFKWLVIKYKIKEESK